MDTNKIEINTERLILKPITLGFKEDMFREFTREVTTYMFPQPTKNISGIEDFIVNSIEKNRKGTNFQLVIIDKNSSEFLGCVGLHHLDTKAPELGIWVKKSAHGNGYGFEAIKYLKEWAEDTLDYDYLYYPVAKDNVASRKIPESLEGKLLGESKAKNSEGKEIIEVKYRIYKK